MILSVFGWIVWFVAIVVWGVFIKSKGWPKWADWAGFFVILILCAMLFPANAFTGNIQKDAKIVYERIYEDGEDVDKVTNELAEYYVDKGYGMNNAKQVLIIVSDMYSNSSN